MVKKKKNEEKSEKKYLSKSKEDLVMENLITLQKVLTNLAVRIDALTDQTSRLLSLFEVSAKSLVQRQSTNLNKEDKEFIEKLDLLIEQNKLIAKSVTMMNDRHRESISRPAINREDIRPKPLPRRI